jgi:hypothetical protein
MSEASLWDYLRQGILPAKGHYSRIESDTSQGFPDVHYTLNGQSGTIELKFAHHPKKEKPFSGESGVVGLRKSQLDWMEDEDEANGVIWICAQVGDRVYLISGNSYRDDFNDLTLEALERLSAHSWVRGKEYPTKILENLLSESL